MKMKIKSLTIILILFFINSDEWLVVTGAYEPVYPHAGEDVTLSCSGDTHVNVKELQVEWRKTEDDGDILVLLYAGGEYRPHLQHDRYSGRAEFFTEEIPKGNFSMKLRNVRFEDKGEFRCEVHSDTGSASTTARIAAVGYSSWHWGILVLCIAVILVLIPTAALLARNCIKECKCVHPSLPHWSLVILPPIVVSLAFSLWGVTEGSTGEAVTCAAVNLLNILMLFIMDPSCLFSDLTVSRRSLIQSTGVTIIVLTICTIPFIEFLKTYFTTESGKIALGVFIGGLVVILVFVASLQCSFFWIWERCYNYFWMTLPKRLRRTIYAIAIVLFIMVLVIIGLGVFVGKRFSDRPDLAAFIIIQMIMLLIPYVGLEIFLIVFINADQTQKQLLLYRFHDIFSSLIWWYTIVAFTFYVNFAAWVEDSFSLGYFIGITVISLGISLCFIATIFPYSFKCFYVARKILVGILFSLHLILNICYLSVILEHDKGRTVKICELVFIYILTAANNIDWYWNRHLAELRNYIYFSGTFVLLLLNFVALAVVLILKADTGKQPLDLRLIVLNSGSVFLFGWFVIQMSAYWLGRGKRNVKDPEPDQPKMTKEQLKFINEVCERQDETAQMVMTHMLHYKSGLSCWEAKCPLSEIEYHHIIRAFLNRLRLQDPEPDQPKVTKEQLKFLNKVCERQDQTVDKIVIHMFHLKVGKSCQEVKCTLSEMANPSYDGTESRQSQGTAGLQACLSRKRKLSSASADHESDQEKPEMTEEQLKFLSEVSELTTWMIVMHLFHLKVGTSCQDANCPLSIKSDGKNQSNDGPAASKSGTSPPDNSKESMIEEESL